MSKRARRNHAPAFKAKVALALDRQTPDQAYFNRLSQIAAA